MILGIALTLTMRVSEAYDMSMIRGEIQLDREVVSRRVSVGGEAPFRREGSEWVNKSQPELRVERVTLAEVLGRHSPQTAQQVDDSDR